MSIARPWMRMLAYVERNEVAVLRDSWGATPAPVWSEMSSPIPCIAWQDQTGTRKTADGERVAIVDSVMMMTPANIDLTERDRIARIADRSGSVIFEGPMVINYSVWVRGHIEWSLGQGRSA